MTKDTMVRVNIFFKKWGGGGGVEEGVVGGGGSVAGTAVFCLDGRSDMVFFDLSEEGVVGGGSAGTGCGGELEVRIWRIRMPH